MSSLATLLLTGLAGLCLAMTGYLALLAILAGVASRRRSRPVDAIVPIVVLVPAHDEAQVLPSCLRAVAASDYPRKALRVIVIADNCADATADIARAAGVEVWERDDPMTRGKGHALAWAQERLLAEPAAPAAVVILDADTQPDRGFFPAIAAEIVGGAQVAQGYYTVANALDGWRPALLTCALALLHYARPLGRRMLGGGVGLKGNGMAFTPEALRAAPFTGASVVEDAEQTQRLIAAGIFPRFAPEAIVRAQMSPDGDASRPQRRRWELGRYALVRRWALRLIVLAIRRRSGRTLDAAIDLLIPPLGELVALLAAGTLLTLLAAPAGQSVALWAAAWAGLAAYLGVGWWAARTPWACLRHLLWAPYFIVWKLWLYAGTLLGGERAVWIRTRRLPAP